MTAKVLWCQKWEESERGWGCRPDGYSLHVNKQAADAFIAAYWKTMPDTAPSEYSRPDGTPYETPVSQAIYDYVAASENGVRSWALARTFPDVDGSMEPWPGGDDGWSTRDKTKLPRLDK